VKCYHIDETVSVTKKPRDGNQTERDWIDAELQALAARKETGTKYVNDAFDST
jgi:hypothetical protein